MNHIDFKMKKNLAGKISTKGFLVVSEEGNGYRTCISNKYIGSGALYYEIQLENEKGAVRVGFGTGKLELLAPLGYDKYGYSYGSKHGYSFNKSTRRRYGMPYKKGDIIGSFISINREEPSESYIEFYLNGVSQGWAFEDIPSECYFPSVSLYDGGCVNVNFGPYFAYYPQSR